jgi:hypothetical protein
VTSPPLPWASQPAIKHPPTRRTIRWRLIRHATLILMVWPALVLIPPLSGDKSLIPLWGMVMCTGVPVLLPLNIWAAVSALKAYNRLSSHPWRLVECEVVPGSSHGWRLRAYAEQPQGRDVRVPAILRINGRVVTPSPFRRYVSPRLGHLWCAGDPLGGGVASEPGGASPFRLVRYKGPLPAGESSGT